MTPETWLTFSPFLLLVLCRTMKGWLLPPTGRPLVGNNTLAGQAYQNICLRVLGKEVPFLDLEHPVSLWARFTGIFHKSQEGRIS